MRKAETLKRSIDIITGQREEDYGDAHKNFSDVAGLWSIVLGTKVQPLAGGGNAAPAQGCSDHQDPDA